MLSSPKGGWRKPKKSNKKDSRREKSWVRRGKRTGGRGGRTKEGEGGEVMDRIAALRMVIINFPRL